MKIHSRKAKKFLSKIGEYVKNADKEDTLRIIKEMEENGLIESNVITSTQFNFKILTKEEVEQDRCKAYNYLI